MITSKARDIIVVKVGGAAIDCPEAANQLMLQVSRGRERGYDLVLVHGGGDRLTQLATRLGVEAPFVEGRRVTSDDLIDVAKLVFAGGVASDLLAVAHRNGLAAVALSGVSCGLIQVVKRPARNGIDYGWVGDIKRVNTQPINALLAAGITPLVASLGVDDQGQVYNVNADTIACELAIALNAHRLVILTGPDGVLRDVNDPSSRIASIRARDILDQRLDFEISGGMLPKLTNLANAVNSGVSRVHVASWQRPGVLDRCLESGGVGTRIC